MFSIPLLVFLSFGIINIHAQECKDVKMKISLTKPGRVELDVDQICRCAGYSKSPTSDAPVLSKWKIKPTTDADIVAEKPSKDKRSTFKDIDILTENTTEIATESSSTVKDTDTVTEKRVVIDKTPITITTEVIKDKAAEKRDEMTHKTYRNVTTGSADKVTEKKIVDRDKNFTLVTEKSVAVKDSVKNFTEKVTKEISTDLTTDKDIDIVEEIDVITHKSPSDLVTESSIDMVTVKTVVDKETDKNSSDMVRDHKGSTESDRSLTTEIVMDLIEKVIEMTTEKSVVIIDKRPTDLTTEKNVVYKAADKNSTDYVIDKRLTMTERDVDVETKKSIVDTVIHKSSTEKDIVIIPIALTTEKVTRIPKEKTDKTTDRGAIDLTTESAEDMITEKGIVDKSAEDKVIESSTSLMAEKTADIPSKTEKSVSDKATDTKSKDTYMSTEKSTMGNATEKISTHEVIIKIPILLTTENVTEKSITDKTLDRTTTDKAIVKSFVDLTTERSIDKVTGKNVTEKVVNKSIKESVTTTSTTETRKTVNVTDKPYHRNDTPPTTEKIIKHEKKMENSTEAALGTSDMTKISGNKLQILLILLASMVMAGLVFAVCYTVYMSHRSNSYVLPTPNHEATALNSI